jgi:acetate kinase
VDGFGPEATLNLERGGRLTRERVAAADAGHAVRAVLERLTREGDSAGGVPLHDVQAVGHRVVHGGTRFRRPVRIDEQVLADLAPLSDLAPLHNAPALAEIRAVREVLGARVPAVAVFDTAFFRDLPERAWRYALPIDLAERHGIRRYGFHGVSHAYLAERYSRLAAGGRGSRRIVTLHLGSGSSAAAIRDGRPVDTSMGFSPLEGLVMATRSGDLDPAIVAFLVEREGLSPGDVEEWLNRRSGLLGLCGRSDMRDVLGAARAGDARAEVAADVFCYRARKYVGAYVAALGGLEAVVFSGGIGENLPEVRARICAGLEACGLRLDSERNARTVGIEAAIHAEGSAIAAWVLPTREELWIARETVRCLTGGREQASDDMLSGNSRTPT